MTIENNNIDSKFYSKLQLGISKYQEKTPADPLKQTFT